MDLEELVIDGEVESQKPYARAEEGRKSHRVRRVASWLGHHVDSELAQGYDMNSDLELLTSWG